MNEKFDRRRKYYVVLDCETATLPYAKDLPENVEKAGGHCQAPYL